MHVVEQISIALEIINIFDTLLLWLVLVFTLFTQPICVVVLVRSLFFWLCTQSPLVLIWPLHPT